MLRSFAALSFLTFAVAVGCSGRVALGGATDTSDGGGGNDAGNVAEAGTYGPFPVPTGTLAQASKVDLLLVIDNSASMGDKQDLLRFAVPDLIARLVTPNCIDAAGNVVGQVTNGVCAQGKAEFAPVGDLHVGVVSTSLGERGADICDGTDPVGVGAIRHDDDQAHLLTRAGANETPLPDAPQGFLVYGPGGITDKTQFVSDVTNLVAGVHEYGCGIEEQLESWYRFLVQPDPYAAIIPDPRDDRRRALSGVDATILRQRHDFLRPDSLVAVVLLTDEDDSGFDPLAIGAQGWAYAEKRFPGSVGGGAARGTSACDSVSTIDTNACTSCGFPGFASDPGCQKPGDTDQSIGQPQLGYYAAKDDTLNTRFMRMRERYGVDPQFPLSRYWAGLSSAKVPDRSGEHASTPSPFGGGTDYLGALGCTNPLFASDLPTYSTQELCNLPAGPRSPNLVVFAAITGVPWQMLTQDPKNPDSPFVSPLPADRWPQIIGNHPDAYDLTGLDPHMVQSQSPRPGLPPPTASDTADPYNGREWDTGTIDLQYACTFPLPAPKDCTDKKFSGACDCASGTPPLPPLCDATTRTIQVRGKAYPGIRPLTLVRDMGDRGIAASICPRQNDTNNPDYGYRPAVRQLVARMAHSLVPQQ